MKAFVVLDEGYINQAVVSLSSFFRYNRVELVIYAEKGTDLTRLTAILPKELVEDWLSRREKVSGIKL